MLFSANAVSKAKGQLHAQTRARQGAAQERKLREQVRVLPICLPVCLRACCGTKEMDLLVEHYAYADHCDVVCASV